MIIKYKMFETSEIFEKFQNENDIKICGIQPMVGAIDMEAITANKDIKLEAQVRVFVTYSEE